MNLIFEKEIIFKTYQRFEEELAKIKERCSLIHPNLLKLIWYQVEEKFINDETVYSIKAYYEYFDEDLN